MGAYIEKLLAMKHGLQPIITAVVHPVDAESLQGAIAAAKEGLIIPILVGPVEKINAVAAQLKIDLSPYQIVAVAHSNEAAEVAESEYNTIC